MSDVIPDGWSKSNIHATCDVLDSKRIPLNSRERATRKGDYPYYGANGVQGYIDDYIFEGEHVLLAEDGGNFDQWESRAISYLVSGKFWVNNHAHILKAKKHNETRFIHYNLVHKNILKHINGGTRAKLNQSDMRDIELLRPPLPEQQKIAAILSSVDDVIEKTQAQIEKLKDLKTGMMQELLSPREPKAGDQTSAQASKKNGLHHTEFKDSPLGRIPAGWEVQYLEEVATIQTGAAKNSKAVGDFIEMPYLRVANVQDGFLDLTEIKKINIEKHRVERFLLRNDDVLVNEGGDFDKLGRGSIWRNQVDPCVHQNHVFVVRTNQNLLLPMFFNHLSGSQHGKKYYMGCAKQTTNLASINSSQLKKFPVLLPPIESQVLICKSINTIDGKIDKVAAKLTTTQQLKKALMQDLLTGKVRVSVN